MYDFVRFFFFMIFFVLRYSNLEFMVEISDLFTADTDWKILDRHNVVQTEGPLQNTRYHSAVTLAGFQGGSSIMACTRPRDASPSDSCASNTHREIFRNLIKSNRNQIVFTIFRLIRNLINIRFVPN